MGVCVCACVQVGMLASTPTQLFPYKRPTTPYSTWNLPSFNNEARGVGVGGMGGGEGVGRASNATTHAALRPLLLW